MKTLTQTLPKTTVLLLLLLIAVDSFAAEGERLAASFEIGSEVPDLDKLENLSDDIKLSFNGINTTGLPVINECSPAEGGYSLTFDVLGSGYSDGNFFPNDDAGSVILIENTGSKPVTKIIFHGTASNNTAEKNVNLFCSFMLKEGRGIAFLLDDSGFDSSGIPFPAGNVCQSVTFDLVAADIADHDGSSVTPEDIQGIRLTLASDAGNNAGDRISVQAMEIYTEGDGTDTGIGGTVSADGLTYSIVGDMLTFNRTPDKVVLYDVSGKSRSGADGSGRVSLSGLNRGVYIVRASEKNGKSSTFKIVK